MRARRGPAGRRRPRCHGAAAAGSGSRSNGRGDARGIGRLAQVLDLDPAVRLQVNDAWAIPAGLVPEPIPLPELIAIALLQRPELQARQAAIRAAMLELGRTLPGFAVFAIGCAGLQCRFIRRRQQPGSTRNCSTRRERDSAITLRQLCQAQDVDTVCLLDIAKPWSRQRSAMIRAGRSNQRIEEFRQVEVLDRVRMEVAVAHARARTRLAKIEIR